MVRTPRQLFSFALSSLAKGLVGPEDMLLTDVLVEGLRPHPGRQRTKVRREIQR